MSSDYNDGRYTLPSRGDNRTVPKETRRNWQVGRMWDKHHEIKRLLLIGHTNVEIAEMVGCTPQTVSNVKNSEIVQEELSIMRAARDAESIDVATEIRNLAPVAIGMVKEVINGQTIDGEKPNLPMRLRTAEKLLDRAGYGGVQRSVGVHAVFTKDDLDEIKQRAFASGTVIDIGVVAEAV